MHRPLSSLLSIVSLVTCAASAQEPAALKPEPSSTMAKTSEIIGLTVKNKQDETLGKVDNIVLDLASGRVVAVIVSSGGFLGLGDELSAVPPAALRFTPDRSTLLLDASKERLGSAPHFKPAAWPDFAHTGYTGGVYRAYQVTPYFATAADNTARNARDRDTADTLTPIDQGSSKADTSITAQIRRDVTALNNISVNAQNVKIITLNGRVTLRGPVNTADERQLIGSIAERIVRAKNVDNQLEVKSATAASN
ncbi:PRC-barrel domain-containing protein [Prosthecobacter sp.]|uniref:PRC-barrel domain-containing protein n=1 Tax=Prosthecobacter sp. TaxID=1965333 RepID=UPI002ABC007E|nr:PRC-barrel domain-containing protein [Prosthecobacter sp.]MDZ4401758.1 PRC-barrel domain-containing protein [Prosthecobacter sp.]